MVGDEIFPANCFMRLNGKIMNNDALYFLKTQKQNEEHGFGVQHPCFDCGFNTKGICDAAEIGRGEEGKQYLVFPKSSDILIKASYEP